MAYLGMLFQTMALLSILGSNLPGCDLSNREPSWPSGQCWPWHLGYTSLGSPSSLFFSFTTSSLLVLKVRIKTIYLPPWGPFPWMPFFQSRLKILITFAKSSSSRSSDHWRRPLAWRRPIWQRNGSLPCKCPLHTSSKIPRSRWTLLLLLVSMATLVTGREGHTLSVVNETLVACGGVSNFTMVSCISWRRGQNTWNMLETEGGFLTLRWNCVISCVYSEQPSPSRLPCCAS